MALLSEGRILLYKQEGFQAHWVRQKEIDLMINVLKKQLKSGIEQFRKQETT
jgi:hypothetical protein